MKKKVCNPYVETYKELWNSVLDTHTTLIDATIKVIIRKNVIDLYPYGPDQDKAIKDYEESRRAMLHIIGIYDSKVEKLAKYYAEFYDKIEEYHGWRPSNMPTSHEIVERAYENIIRG